MLKSNVANGLLIKLVLAIFIMSAILCGTAFATDTATSIGTKAQVDGTETKVGIFGAKFEPVDPTQKYSGGMDYLPMLRMSQTGDPNRKPFISQMYEPLTIKPSKMTGKTLNIQNFFPGTKIILGMALPQNNSVELAKVYDGTYDASIHKYAEDCKNLGNDIFLRMGYECDGKWNGYAPENYKKAFQYIVDIFRNDGVTNVAFVWCVAGPTGTNTATMFDWYPGDSYVDWFGFDPYGKGDFVPDKGYDWNPAWFKQQGDAHSKPIIICENSRSDTSASLDEYFNNLFSNLRNPDYGIRAFLYQNHDSTMRPKWTNWGNSIYTDDPKFIAQYNTEMQNPIYLHRDSSYYDPIALYVEASRKGKELKGTPYDKSLDGYSIAAGYDYTVTSSDTTHNSSGGWAWNPIWESPSNRITIDLTVPSLSSGYVILRLPSNTKMDLKLGSAPNQRTVAEGVKPLNGQAFMKYKYESTDIINGKLALTLESAQKNLWVATIGIQTISDSAPDAPSGVQAWQTSDSVSLSWNEVSGAMRYNIYRDGELVGTSVTTTFIDTNVPAVPHKYTISASSLKQGEGNMSSNTDLSAPVKVQVDGKMVKFDVNPIIKNERTLVPFRKILETMGAIVNWDEDTNTVTCNKGNTEIKLIILETVAYVNGEAVKLDVPAEIINDRTFVPLRFISENLNCKVDWNGNTSTVLITTTQKNSNEKIGRFGAKFEPKDPNAIYSGAGQTFYYNVLSMAKTADPDRKPFLINMYAALNAKPDTKFPEEVMNLQNLFPGAKMILGMMLPKSNPTELAKVSDGTYDASIHKYAADCKNLSGEIFLRIGFEFDGKWNGYDAENYKTAFRHIVDLFNADGVTNVAFVWCASDPEIKNMMDWYPGDEYVDWFAFDIFGDANYDATWYKKQADEHSKPILIGESSRSKKNVPLKEYFDTYFANLKNPNYGISGFEYINWDWSLTTPGWAGWGNSMYTKDPEIVKLYNDEMKNPRYIHRDSSYYDPAALYVRGALNGTNEEVKDKPYSKALDQYVNAPVYDYTVVSADSVTNQGDSVWGRAWAVSSNQFKVDLTVPRESSGYVMLTVFKKDTENQSLDIKLGSGAKKRTVAIGFKPSIFYNITKYKYNASDVTDGILTLTIDKATNMTIYAIGIQTISDSAPAAPEGVQGDLNTDSVSLNWNSVNDIMRYNIYRDGELIGTSITTSFIDVKAPVGPHNYTISASSLKQGEGNMSSAANVTVPIN